MKKDWVVGVDCSTTSCKAVVWDATGSRVAESRHKLSISTPQPLWYEQSAEDWWQAASAALNALCEQIDPDRLAAICIAHQRETFVPVDEDGLPLRNAILWMDERAGGQLAYLDGAIGRARFHQLTGKPLSGNLSAAKLAWLRECEAGLFKKTSKFLDVHSFLVLRLTGHFRTGWGCAGPMGLFDLQQNRWSGEILGSLDLKTTHFPDAFPAGDVIGQVNEKAAGECGLPAGLPVVAGLGDGQAAGLGTGITKPGEAYLSLGTSVVSGTYTAAYHISNDFRTMYGGIRDTYLLETVILGGA
jgi:xylulokinase